MAVLVAISVYKKEVAKELEQFDCKLKNIFMAPKDIERVEDKLEAKLTTLGSDFNKFRVLVEKRLTRVETIIWLLFSSNSIASIAVFFYSYVNNNNN